MTLKAYIGSQIKTSRPKKSDKSDKSLCTEIDDTDRHSEGESAFYDKIATFDHKAYLIYSPAA